MTYRGATVRAILGVSLVLVLGCGAKSADGSASDDSGGSHNASGGAATSLATGGRVATGGSGNGTVISVSGGKASAGGQSTLTGGTLSGSTGGTRSTGGKSGVGGKSNPGGASSAGGTLATGGKGGNGGGMLTGGKTGATGGTTTASSLASTAGNGGASGSAATGGGAVTLGGTSSSGGSTSDAGDPLTEFCQGDQSKILYQGIQEVAAPASSYQSGLVMDCCIAYGVNLHAKAALGFDLDVETIWSAGGVVSPGLLTVGSSLQPMRAMVHRSTDSSSSAGVPAEGTAQLFTALSYEDPFDLGLCLSLYKTATTLWQTLIYVPKVTIATYGSRTRFQIFLLSDSTITPSRASVLGLDALELAQNPILDLNRIAYVSSSTDEIGFNPGQKIGVSLQTQVNAIGMAVPFVIMADGVRLSLGTFVSNLSSASYPGPSIMIEDIQTDSMVLHITGTGPDPLKDSRTLTALRETGKLI